MPANQIDPLNTGYVVARNGNLTTPSNKLWFFNVTRNPTTGRPVFGPARGVTVGTYAIPPAATRPVFTQKLATGDARMTQAVQAFDPRTKTFSFWTQHTIAFHSVPSLPTTSAPRWYEIDPVPATPCSASKKPPCFGVLRSGIIGLDGYSFFFNAAISPDRESTGQQNCSGIVT